MDHKRQAAERFSEVEAGLYELSRWLYENPELAYAEYEASARLAGMLAEHGFAVTFPAYDLETAFDARSGRGSHEVIVCAEYDALPEIGHACGHNIIAAAGLGAGIALAPVADDLDLTVRVLGTPAEEGSGGKIDLIGAGAFSTAELAMMVHPADEDLAYGKALAVLDYKVAYFGKEAHSAASPAVGRNALDAAVQAYANVAMLRQQIPDAERVHGIITDGGAAANVIPAHTEMAWMVRAQTAERLDELAAKVIACFEAAAISTGCRVEIVNTGRFTDLVNDPVLAEIYADNSAELGRIMDRDPHRPARASTDMGNVSHELPAIQPILDIRALPAVNHQREFAAHTVTAAGNAAIHDGALAMAWTIIDVASATRWNDLTRP